MSRRASFVLTACLAAALGGCASAPSQPSTSAPPFELLAATTQEDIVELLVRLYPPAQTQLTLARPAQDALGQELVKTLRERGYAIEEPEVHGRRAAREVSVTGLAFSYQLAPIQGDALYELVVTVGQARLSRVYMLDGEGASLVPAGHWARRE